MKTLPELVEAARRDVADADRCAALHVTPAVHQLHRRLREVTDALAALSTPPADDVREAFVNGWYSARQNPGIAAATHSPDFPGEVRPRGTVTDAEVKAALDAYLDGAEPVDWQPGAMRVALEAAREARP